MRADVSLRGAAYMAAPAGAGRRLAHGAPGRAHASRDGHARALGDSRRRHRRGRRAGAAAGRQPARVGRLRRRDAGAGAARGARGRFAAPVRHRLQRRSRAPRHRARRRPGPHRGGALRRGRRTVSSRRRARATRSRRGSASQTTTLLVVRRGTAGAEERVRVPDRRHAGTTGHVPASSSRSPATATCATSSRARAATRGVADRVPFPRQPSAGRCRAAARGRRHRRGPVGAGRQPATSTACRTSCMEALASGTPLVTTPAGGIGAVVRTTADRRSIVPERDAQRIGAGDCARWSADPDGRTRARRRRPRRWSRRGSAGGARRSAFEAAYDRALAFKSSAR